MKRKYRNGQSFKAKTTSSNEAANRSMETKTDEKKTSRKRKVDPMVQLNSQIIKKFRSLPSDLQNTSTKVSCINSVLASNKEKCGDPSQFYGWILNQAELVMRTFDFKDVCKNKDLEGHEQAVAEHLVLEGKAECNNIRMNGLATYQGNIKRFREKLVPDQYRFDQPSNDKNDLNGDADE